MSINLTEEQINRVERIISGIAYRKRMIAPREYTIEDLKSELWLTALECINEMGSVEEGLIATKCYSKIVDLIRKSKRKSLFTMDSSIMDRMGDTEDDNCDYGSEFIENEAKTTVESLIIKDMLSQFKKDSNEYKFLDFMIKYSKANPDEDYDGPDKTAALDGYLSKMLGYASSSSGSYRKLRNKVRTMIKLYNLGADLNMMYKLESIGFKCYGDSCLGWKYETLGNGKVIDLEIYSSKGNPGEFTLYINSDDPYDQKYLREVCDFGSVDELIRLINYIKSHSKDR